jgi:CelD/BcsL family acetyltransferase involved in cellulose biosynthesis
LSSLDELLEIAPSLDNFQTFMSSPIGQYDWIISAAQHLMQESSLYICLACDGNQPVALAPLLRKDRFSICRQFQIYEPMGFCYRDVDSLHRLTDLMASSRVPLFLERIPDDASLISSLKESYRHRAKILIKDSDSCPYLDIEGDGDHAIDSLPSRLRSDLRRAMRKARELGETSAIIHAPTGPDELEPLWEKALAVEASGWKAQTRSALLFDRQHANFLHAYARRASQRGLIRISFLKIGGETAATEIALVTGNRYWILKIGYDERFSRVSPGMLLMQHTLRYAADQGLMSYELLGTAADWTRRWTQKERKTFRVMIYPYTLHGAALLVRAVLRHLHHKLIPGASRREKSKEDY